VVRAEKGKGGRSLSFKVELSSGRRAYFKPEQSFAADWFSEVASYHLDRALGLGRLGALAHPRRAARGLAVPAGGLLEARRTQGLPRRLGARGHAGPRGGALRSHPVRLPDRQPRPLGRRVHERANARPRRPARVPRQRQRLRSWPRASPIVGEEQLRLLEVRREHVLAYVADLERRHGKAVLCW
jgi:hypothetical protein